ncbi:hypothetical protein Tco_0332797 [Tanacetum coccineum]
MLDKTNFTSWQQHIQLYCRGKENGVNILKSIDEGPFQMGTIRDPIAEGTEGAQQLGPERARVYSDLSPEDKDRFVTAVKLNSGLRDSNYDQLYAYLKQHEAYANENKMMLDRFTQHTVDPLALMSNVSQQKLNHTLALLHNQQKLTTLRNSMRFEASMERAQRDEFLAEKDKSRKRRRDDQDPPPPPPDSDLVKRTEMTLALWSSQPMLPQSSALEEPIPDDERPATPKPAWVIPTSHIPDAMNNWANALATTYQAPADISLLEKTWDMQTFMN